MDRTDEVDRGVTLSDGRRVRTQEALVGAIEERGEFIEGLKGKKCKYTDGLEALGIDPSWLADGWILSLIAQFLFYRHAPHLAYAGEYGLQPYLWVESCITLDGVFGVSL